MYLSQQGQGAFWPAGTVRSNGGPVQIKVTAEEPSSFQNFVGVRRQVWLGSIAATRGGAAAGAAAPILRARTSTITSFTARAGQAGGQEDPSAS